jgi:hypothetical protein
MLGYLTIMSGSAVVITFAILVMLFRKKDLREIMKYCAIGLLVASIDIVVEYLGTSTGHWVYNESIYFIFNLIPIELISLFFSAGVILRFIFLNMNKIKIPLKTNAIFYILILIASLMWVREIYQKPATNMLPLAILIGLWGISNISDKNKEGSLILAMAAVGLDLVSEIIVIGGGSYSYKNGFALSIPITYGLFTLGLLAVMEKLHKLDNFLDQPFIRNLLRLFSVYRENYTKKFVKVKEKR